MDPLNRDLDRLEEKIERLRREYDLFLAGKRKGEPLAIREEVEREILRLTRSPLSSTATRFRIRALAHRFQAVGTQVRNLVELRVSRKRARAAESPDGVAVLLDRAAVENPASVEPQLGRIQKAIAEAVGGPISPPFPVIRERLFEEARRQMSAPDVVGVRFSVVKGEKRPKIRGEVVRNPKAEEGEPSAPVPQGPGEP